MTMLEIMRWQIHDDLVMMKIWREKMYEAENDADAEMYRKCMLRNFYRLEAKEELIQSLGYTVLYNDDRDEFISIYPMELDD